MKEIHGPAEYQATFGDISRRKEAHKYALEIRKFEIELYWKRASYFWTLLTATFGGNFALIATDKRALAFLVSCIGLVLSAGWYLVNRGSKYWQENWERHVDALEDDVVGPLYKMTISKQLFPEFAFWGGYPYSVSRVNQLISLFVTLVWLGIAIWLFPGYERPAWLVAFAPSIAALGTFIFLVLLFVAGRGRSAKKKRLVRFHLSDLE